MAADIWAVGNVLYALAYGKKILEQPGMTRSRIGKILREERDITKYLSTSNKLGEHRDKVHSIVLRLLDRDVETRILNFQQLWESCVDK